MRLVDTHCHLQLEQFNEDREAVIAECLELLDWLVIIGDDIESSGQAVELTRDRIYAAVALHPYHAEQCDDAALAQLREWAAHPKVKAIGEIGLDYFNEYAPRDKQAIAFRKQLELACEVQLPVCIHNREADADSYALLKEFSGKLPGCIMHCFGSDAGWAEKFAELGFYISFAGNLSYPKAQSLRDAAAMVPLEQLLVETDAPYLSPQPKRGKRCLPHYVQYTAETLAQVKGVALEEIIKHTTSNAHRLYGIPL